MHSNETNPFVLDSAGLSNGLDLSTIIIIYFRSMTFYFVHDFPFCSDLAILLLWKLLVIV